MKKLLALVLILAMSSTAMANLVSVVRQDGLTDYVAGTTITIEIAASGFAATPSTKIGLLDIAAITTDNAGADALSVGVLNPILTVNLGWTNGTLGDYPNLIEGIVGRASMGQGVLNDVLYTFDLTIASDTVGEITIDLSGLVIKNPYNAVMATDTACLTLVPEPMTIALLGLGGLFLRRRRS